MVLKCYPDGREFARGALGVEHWPWALDCICPKPTSSSTAGLGALSTKLGEQLVVLPVGVRALARTELGTPGPVLSNVEASSLAPLATGRSALERLGPVLRHDQQL